MEELLSVDQVRACLAERNAPISAKTLYRYLEEGRLAGKKLGKNWRVSHEELDAFLAGGTPKLAPGTPRSFGALDSGITWLAGVTSRASAMGIDDILEPRAQASGATVSAIRDALENTEQVDLIGVSLTEYFGDKLYRDVLNSKLKSGKAYRVRALLLNPQSNAAKARTEREAGDKFGKTITYTSSPLWNDIKTSLGNIQYLRQRVNDNQGASPSFSIEAKFIDISPIFYLVLTPDCAFLEIYHLGRQEDADDGSCIGALSPVFQVGPQSERSFYHLLKSHFEYLWNGKHNYITVTSLDDMKRAIDSEELATLQNRGGEATR